MSLVHVMQCSIEGCVVRHERPRITGGPCLRKVEEKPVDEIVSVPGVPEYVPSLYAADHDMVEDACCIKSGLAGHEMMIAEGPEECQLKYLRTSLPSFTYSGTEEPRLFKTQ